MEKVDVRNDKTVVKVNVMKDRTYNVHAKMEVVYDLEPKKVVDLLTNNVWLLANELFSVTTCLTVEPMTVDLYLGLLVNKSTTFLGSKS